MLLNALTDGYAWRKHGITEDRVLARNAHIAEGSASLWEFAVNLVREAVGAGNLAPKP